MLDPRTSNGGLRRIATNVEQKVLFTVPSRQVMQSISPVVAPYEAFVSLNIRRES